MAVIYNAKILLKTGYGSPGTVLDLGEAGYDVSTKQLWIGNGIGNPASLIYADTSGLVTYAYVDGSFNTRDLSINDLYLSIESIDNSLNEIYPLVFINSSSIGYLSSRLNVTDSSLANLTLRHNSTEASLYLVESSLNVVYPMVFRHESSIGYLDSCLGTKYDKAGGQITGEVSIFGPLNIHQFIQFENSTFINVPGKLQWDVDEETLSFGLNDGGSVQVGKETFDYYKNSSGVTLVDGDVVSIIGASGGRAEVSLTNATSTLSSTACIGMITSGGGPGATVRVTKIGDVHGINTISVSEGNPVYVDPANPGKLTPVPPQAPNVLVHVGMVSRSHATDGIISVDVRPTGSFKNLSDVNGTLLTVSGQIPTWHADSSYFDFDKNINDYTLTTYVDGSLNNIRATYIPDVSLNDSYFKWVGGYLEPSVAGSGGVSQAYVDGSLNNIRATYIPNASLGSDFVWNAGILEVSANASVTTGKNLYIDASGNVAVVDSPNFAGDVSIQQRLFVDQHIQLKNYTLSNSSTGQLWWQSPRLFFNDGSANRDLLQGSLKGLTYPVSSSEGDQFYRTDNGLLFLYDGSRAKYLSVTRPTLNGGRATVATNSDVYIRVGDATQSSTAGYRMFRNGTILSVSAYNNNTLANPRVIEFRVNNSTTNKIALTVPAASAGAHLNNGNLDFSEGDLIQVVALTATNAAMSNLITVLEIAWRS